MHRRHEPTDKHQMAMFAGLREHFRATDSELLSTLEWREIGKPQDVPRHDSRKSRIPSSSTGGLSLRLAVGSPKGGSAEGWN